MQLPKSDHPITLGAASGRVVVRFNGTIIANTQSALELRESTYPPVLYIPRQDIDAQYFVRSDHHTHCPYKGDASYFSLEAGGHRAENAVWSYEQPFPAVAQIKAFVAFYPNKVNFEVGSP